MCFFFSGVNIWLSYVIRLIMLNLSETERPDCKEKGFSKVFLHSFLSCLQHLLGVMVVQFVLVTGWFFTISLHRYFLLLSLGAYLLC